MKRGFAGSSERKGPPRRGLSAVGDVGKRAIHAIGLIVALVCWGLIGGDGGAWAQEMVEVKPDGSAAAKQEVVERAPPVPATPATPMTWWRTTIDVGAIVLGGAAVALGGSRLGRGDEESRTLGVQSIAWGGLMALSGIVDLAVNAALSRPAAKAGSAARGGLRLAELGVAPASDGVRAVVGFRF